MKFLSNYKSWKKVLGKTPFALKRMISKNSTKINTPKISNRVIATIAGISILLAGTFNSFHAENFEDSELPKSTGDVISSLPTITLEELVKHKSPESHIWVTFRNGVYDITDFVESHPGGDQILQAAGSSIDDFWNAYPIHKTKDTFELLESFRIGNILNPPESMFTKKSEQSSGASANDPFASDPERLSTLHVLTEKPFNAETPLKLLSNSYLTPNNIHFVRNHHPVPVVESEADFKVSIEAPGYKTLDLTVEDLKRNFENHTIVAALQCSGNRRVELAQVKAAKGLSWTGGAIGNAEYTGVLLRDVIRYFGMLYIPKNLQHVHFEGADRDPRSHVHYEASIPLKKAMDPTGDVLLAFEMNGQPLPRDHGYPLRVIVPGYSGVRNVKWVKKIQLASEESTSFWQKLDYKGFSPSITTPSKHDYEEMPPIMDMPVTSLICSPSKNETIQLAKDRNHINVSGIAWSGGGRGIAWVDVSPDEGKTWIKARRNFPPVNAEQRTNSQEWNWTLWDADVPVMDKMADKIRICSKAVDTSYNVQVESPKSIWNTRGLSGNHWSCVDLKLVTS